MIVGVPSENYPGERRVALVPAVIPNLMKGGMEVLVEAGAGLQAGYPDADYVAKGAKLAASREEVFQNADIVVQFLAHGANDRTGSAVVPQRSSAGGVFAAAGCGGHDSGYCGPRGDFIFGGADAADHAGTEYGRAFGDGDDLWIQGRSAGSEYFAAHVSNVDHGCGNDCSGEGTDYWGGRSGIAGDCHRETAGRSSLGLRHAAGGQRASTEPRRALCRTAD